MNRTKKFNLNNLPSWKYYVWGILNGLFLGISLTMRLDISPEGMISLILEQFSSIFQSLNLPTTWINLAIFSFVIVGLLSLIFEIILIYKKGWPARVIAICGFLAFLLMILDYNLLGVVFLFLGVFMVIIFPEG